ncbi:unnamed protein product, partial [Prorocentrum cordatum]
MLLAEDLGRRVALDWRLSTACRCPWERLVVPVEGLHLLTEELLRQHEALRAGARLAGLWSDACRAADGAGSVREAVDAFDAAHASAFRSGLAHFVDTHSPAWRGMPRLKGRKPGALPAFLRAGCIAVRAYSALSTRRSPTTAPPPPRSSRASSTSSGRRPPSPTASGSCPPGPSACTCGGRTTRRASCTPPTSSSTPRWTAGSRTVSLEEPRWRPSSSRRTTRR